MVDLSQKEWFKLCDDFVSNEIMYVSEDKVGTTHPISGYVESYIKIETGMEVLFRWGLAKCPSYYFRAIIKAAPSTIPLQTNIVNLPLGYDYENVCGCQKHGSLVLVRAAEAAKHTKGVIQFVLPSVVRLEATHQFLEALGESRNPFGTLLETILGVKNGEFMTIECPSQVVQDRIQIVNGISSDKPKPIGGQPPHLKMDASNIFVPFHVYLRNGVVWTEPKEIAGLSFEVLDILPSPIDPFTGEFDALRCHIIRQGVYSQIVKG